MKKERLSILWHVAVLLGLAAAAVKYINGADFWSAMHRFEWPYAIPILLLSLMALLVKGWRFVSQLKSTHRIARSKALRGYVAAQAATVLPGGVAARVGVLEQAGVPPAASAASVAMSSASDQAVLISGALLSALWFEQARRPVLALLAGLIVVSLLLGIEASRTWLGSMAEKVAGRLRLLKHWRMFLECTSEMANAANITFALVSALAAAVLMVEALSLCSRGAGFNPPWLTLVLAYTLPSVLGRISAMPGGVGVTEAGMIGLLNASPGVTLDQAAAAVTVFRVCTVLFAAAVGAGVYFLGWRGRAEAAA